MTDATERDRSAGVPGPSVTARVVAVIANWNGRELLEAALDSLEVQDFDSLKVIVVDNGSTDGSLSMIRSRWPEVHAVGLPQNHGFPAAINCGIRASSGEFVAVLNNDVRLESDWVRVLVAALEGAPRAASATGKLLSARQPEILDGAGDIVGWDGYCVRRGRGRRDRGQYDSPEPVFSACAAAALYRRKAFDEIGLFDERFFAYIEDADWGFRAQLAGHDCVYEPRAVAFHWGRASSGVLDGFELYQCHRNMLHLMVKDFPLAGLVLHLPLAVGRRLGSFVKAARRGHAVTIIRAWLAALASLPASLRARRRIQAKRVRGYGQLSRTVPAWAPVGRDAAG